MNNTNGFQTNVWGAPAWLFLHTIAMNYNPERKQQYRSFFESLQGVIPCGACRDNYLRIISTKRPLNDKVLESRQTFAYWLFLVHNQVQQDIYDKTGLKGDKPKYENNKEDFRKIVQFYEMFRAKCSKNSHGCVVPKKGTRLRAHISIRKFSGIRRGTAIKMI